MALTKEERDALPADQFAFPRTRQCPMHDAKHTKFAWDMIETTKGVTDEERVEARKHVLRRAKELDMDTSGWGKLKAMAMEAMSLEVPEVKDHPNRMPFSGVLVWLDEASDKPPHGSGGRKVIMTKSAAEKAIPSLLGMGVNYTEQLDGHDPQKKIGIVSEANIRAVAGRFGIFIDGFIYASDFPKAAARIRADKKVLGFSFEAQDIKLADPGADILAIEDCVFTGAAILRKDKAAFSTTKLAAQADGEPQELNMDKEELKAILGEALKPVTDRLDKVEASQAKTPELMAKAQTEGMIEPHAKALDACADGMEAAGIGGHPERGHVAIARKMAKHLRASAAMGQIPHVFRDHDFFTASGDNKVADTDAITKAVEAAVKPLKDDIASQKTTISDLKAAATTAVPAPERKTLPADLQTLLAKGEANKDGKFTIAQIDSMLDAQKLQGVDRIEAKTRMQAAGLIAA